MADGTRLKELQEFQRKTELVLMDEKAKRQASEDQLHTRLDQINEAQEGLQATVMNLEHSIGAMQQQLKSIAEQLQNYNRNKSILGEGLTASIERGSSSRITALHPPVRKIQPSTMRSIGWSSLYLTGKKLESGEEQIEDSPEDVDATVSFHAMGGNNSNKTLRINGKVNGKDIHILIDSGSTHCFIDEKVVQVLGCTLEQTTPMAVRIADGGRVMSKYFCPTFCWEIQGHHFSHPVRVLKLGGYDCVLGCDWLSINNPIELDFHQLQVTITQSGKKIILKALTEKGDLKTLSAYSLSKLLRRGNYGMKGQIYVVNKDITQGEKNPRLLDLLHHFSDVFQEPRTLPPERTIEHHIELVPDAIPRKQHPYRYLNKLTVKHNFPIPVIDELLDELHGAKYFSKIDLRSGYFQIRMKKEDVPKTSFITHSGHYEFLVMPFGLCNAPSTFQALMNQVFEPYLRKFVLVFFDDILIYSKEWGLHMLHLKKVLELLRKHQLYAKQSKCSFAQQQIDYLGHVISEGGVATDPEKIECMKNWPVPTSVKALRGFLGLTGYYRKFIKGYGSISKPLTSLLKKDAFNWNLEAETAFNHLKEVMIRAPVLALPNFSKPFIVETDACGKGIGAVLMQEGRPIAYLSKALAAKNMGLSTYEKEFLALLLAVTKWKHYLQGNHFVIRTDQKSLKHILDQRIDSILQQKWITKLLGLSYEVQYKKGSENRAADALSRVEHDRGESQANAVTTQIPLWLQDVQDSYEGNTLFQTVVQAKTLDNLAFPDYSYEAGILRRKGRICVGSHGGIREKIIRSMHDSALGGHSGINGTYQRVKPLFYWPTLKGDINTWVKECEVCQRSKHENIPYPGLLQPLPIPDQAWSCISMDFVEGLPPSEGKDSILVIVDRLTKYSHFLPLKHPYTASSIAKTFFDNIYKLHGLPVSIVTDRDRVFTSRLWKELFSMAGVSLDMSSANHPQTDGQTERVNQCLENYLRCMCHQKPKKWAQWLTLAEFWFNTNFHTGLKTTPFQALYGYPPHQTLYWTVYAKPSQ
ncbi:Retrovirus-related Pol polyprotein from transposon [Sesamum angolense]|uniref:Retrovirus-related Pol polyprotein from transposon n=1 Tax=Sesamum angolense TaxID=2727404 RepID=A0AAE2BKE2_9LAMI|nr:Retrovirus-related Pol polyprotein from transposon [Sesamum angolense]